jgi:apolipoprotein D and lipocalin family protein
MISLKKLSSLLPLCLSILAAALTGCLGIPQGITFVDDFDIRRYLGRWYEIARLDHPFERGLEQVTAEYSMREDGGITVRNRGFSVEEGKWKEVTGKAYPARSAAEGYLKVSFFGPFYSSYVVFELDREAYRYAYVSGPSRSYLWFLSRTPTVDEAQMRSFVETAKRLGFDTSRLIRVRQAP